MKCEGDGKHTQQDKGNTIYGKCNAVQANTLKRAGNTSKSSPVQGQRSEMSTVECEDGARKRGVGYIGSQATAIQYKGDSLH